jgi:hypothetical protein
MNIPAGLVWEKSQRPQAVDVRSLLCYWGSKELGMRMTDIAKRLSLTQPAVSIAVRGGIARENRYSLVDS